MALKGDIQVIIEFTKRTSMLVKLITSRKSASSDILDGDRRKNRMGSNLRFVIEIMEKLANIDLLTNKANRIGLDLQTIERKNRLHFPQIAKNSAF